MLGLSLWAQLFAFGHSFRFRSHDPATCLEEAILCDIFWRGEYRKARAPPDMNQVTRKEYIKTYGSAQLPLRGALRLHSEAKPSLQIRRSRSCNWAWCRLASFPSLGFGGPVFSAASERTTLAGSSLQPARSTTTWFLWPNLLMQSEWLVAWSGAGPWNGFNMNRCTSHFRECDFHLTALASKEQARTKLFWTSRMFLALKPHAETVLKRGQVGLEKPRLWEWWWTPPHVQCHLFNLLVMRDIVLWLKTTSKTWRICFGRRRKPNLETHPFGPACFWTISLKSWKHVKL